LNLLPDRSFSPVLIERYNAQAAFEFERIRDFLILHYFATERRDSPFWQYCANMSIPEQLADNIALFRDSGRFFRHAEEMFALTSWDSTVGNSDLRDAQISATLRSPRRSDLRDAQISATLRSPRRTISMRGST